MRGADDRIAVGESTVTTAIPSSAPSLQFLSLPVRDVRVRSVAPFLAIGAVGKHVENAMQAWIDINVLTIPGIEQVPLQDAAGMIFGFLFQRGESLIIRRVMVEFRIEELQSVADLGYLH